MKRINSLFFITAALVIVLDQITKMLVYLNIDVSESLPLIEGVLHITYIHNTGSAFGILQGMNTLLIFISMIAIGAIGFYYDKIPENNTARICLALILGGAIGNLIDRIRLGYVIDFIDFRIWPAFNIADSALTIGAVGLIFYYLKNE